MFEEIDKVSLPDYLGVLCKNCKRAWHLRNRYGDKQIPETHYTKPVLWARFMADHLEEAHCTCAENHYDNLIDEVSDNYGGD